MAAVQSALAKDTLPECEEVRTPLLRSKLHHRCLSESPEEGLTTLRYTLKAWGPCGCVHCHVRGFVYNGTCHPSWWGLTDAE